MVISLKLHPRKFTKALPERFPRFALEGKCGFKFGKIVNRNSHDLAKQSKINHVLASQGKIGHSSVNQALIKEIKE